MEENKMPKGSMHVKGYEPTDYKTENKFQEFSKKRFESVSIPVSQKYEENDMLEFMQYIIANPDTDGYSSISKEIAKYFLDDFLSSRK